MHVCAEGCRVKVRLRVRAQREDERDRSDAAAGRLPSARKQKVEDGVAERAEDAADAEGGWWTEGIVHESRRQPKILRQIARERQRVDVVLREAPVSVRLEGLTPDSEGVVGAAEEGDEEGG